MITDDEIHFLQSMVASLYNESGVDKLVILDKLRLLYCKDTYFTIKNISAITGIRSNKLRMLESNAIAKLIHPKNKRKLKDHTYE